MKKYNLFLIAIAGLLISSCVSASFTQTGQSFPEYYGTVTVMTEPPENAEYSEIGIVSAKGGSAHNQAQIIEALQKRAAQNGANAIVLIGREDENVSMFGADGYGAFGSSTTFREMTAVAIRVQR